MRTAGLFNSKQGQNKIKCFAALMSSSPLPEHFINTGRRLRFFRHGKIQPCQISLTLLHPKIELIDKKILKIDTKQFKDVIIYCKGTGSIVCQQ